MSYWRGEESEITLLSQTHLTIRIFGTPSKVLVGSDQVIGLIVDSAS